MQPRPQGQRSPPIPRHQQYKATLPRKPRHGPEQSRRQPTRHHPRAARQRRHGRARVRQADGVAKQPKPRQATGAWA